MKWTPELRQLVYPSRAQPNPAFLVERMQRRSLPYPLDAAACRAAAVTGWGRGPYLDRPQRLLHTGLANNTEHWRRIATLLLERAAAPELELPLEIDLEAASLAAHLGRLDRSFPYWVTRGGIAFAVRTLARCAEITTYGRDHRYLDERGDWFVESRGHSLSEPEGLRDEWPIMRALLAEASDADYAAARDAAAEILDRTTGTCWERGMLLWIPFAFPGEFDERGRETALEIAHFVSTHKNHSDGTAGGAIPRYLSVASIETGLEALVHRKTTIGFPDVLTIIAHRGLDAAMPLIEAMLGKLATEAARKAWCKDYFALRVPAIVQLVAARFPESKAVAAAIAKYNKS